MLCSFRDMSKRVACFRFLHCMLKLSCFDGGCFSAKRQVRGRVFFIYPFDCSNNRLLLHCSHLNSIAGAIYESCGMEEL